MTTCPPRPPPPVVPDQPSFGPDRPLLRTLEFADDGCEGMVPGPPTVDDFFVDWQLGLATSARR